jgi:hypothetical protein
MHNAEFNARRLGPVFHVEIWLKDESLEDSA